MEKLDGSFDRQPQPIQDEILKMVANYHLRNGVAHHDGSIGDIIITHRQLKDLLAFVIKTE